MDDKTSQSPFDPVGQNTQAAPNGYPSSTPYVYQNPTAHEYQNASTNGYQAPPAGGYQSASAYGYSGGYYQPNQGYGYVSPVPSATGAIVCGVCAILFSWIPLVGIILGIVAIALASSHRKKYGKNGSSTGGKICGIVGIAINLVFGILTALLVAFGAMFYDQVRNYAYDESITYPLSFTEAEYVADPSLETDLNQIEDLINTSFTQLFNAPDAALYPFAAAADEDFRDRYGVSLSEIGVDPIDVVRWCVEDGSFHIQSSSIQTFSDPSDANYGNGWVDVSLTMRDITALNDTIETAYSTRGIDLSTPAGKDQMGQIVTEALMECNQTCEYTFEVQLTKVNGTWTLDIESWNNLEEAFYQVFY